MNGLISLVLAAGLAGFAYSKLSQRLGYGNGRSVFNVVAVVFVIGWLAVYITLRFIIKL